MKNPIQVVPMAVLAAFCLASPALADDLMADPATPSEASPAFAAGYVLVKPKAGVSDEIYRATLKAVGAEPWTRQKYDLYRKARVPEGQERAIADQLSTNPLIEWAQPDQYQSPHFMPAEFQGLTWQRDPSNSHQSTPENPGVGCFLNSPLFCDHSFLHDFEAWDTTKGAGQVIAFIDSGIDPGDPDLAGQVAAGGWNFRFGDADTSSLDHMVCGTPSGVKSSCYHGTDVAKTAVGLAGNFDGTKGIKVGVAPEAKAVPFVALNNSEIISAISRAADQGIRIVNISSGTSDSWQSPAIVSAAAYFKGKGGLVINAAGNSNNNLRQSVDAESAIIFVAATWSGGSTVLADYSNRGPSIDFCAPEFTANGGGTSNASPAVSAAASLVWSVNPAFTNVDVEQILRDAAAMRPESTSPDCAGKLLDVGGAVHLAVERAGVQGAADSQPPQVSFNLPFGPVDAYGIRHRATSIAVDKLASVQVDAGDDRGLAEVVLLADGQVIGKDSTAPYQFVLDAQTLAGKGLRSGLLTAQAVDLSGKTASTAVGVPFSVAAPNPSNQDTTPPSIGLFKPNGKTSVVGKTLVVTKLFSAAITATDNQRMDTIRVYIDGREQGTLSVTSADNRSRYARFQIDTRLLANGKHTLKSVAMDGAGLTSEASVMLKVKNTKLK